MGLMDTVDAVKNSFVGDIPFVGAIPSFASAAMHASDAQDAHYKQLAIDPSNSDTDQARYTAWGQKQEYENDQAMTSVLDAIPGVSIGRKVLGIDQADIAGTWDWAMQSVDHAVDGTSNPLSRQDNVAYHKGLKNAVDMNTGEGTYKL